MELFNVGKKVDDIEVKISYKIIELFSGGLYSSPNKAFEELVCNSYDAFADKVSVYVPSDLAADGAFVWVCDNGEGLDQKGLKDLWLIGESKKRIDPSRDKKRLQVGQFGIGKLSTYILAQNLTYLSKKDGRYIIATMDYNLIGRSEDSLTIEERELSEEEAERILNKYVHSNGKYLISFDLFGSRAPDTWTISILTNLKPKAKEIREGRLKWVLQTALPLNPQFNLYYNGSKLESSKINNPVTKEWIIGKDDATAESLDYAECRCDNENYFVDFEYLKNVNGKFTLYEDSLLDGKSGEVGRSHGIFLMIRGRLVNLDDPLLGMDAFSHGAFNRTRIVINADELDSNLTSTRESVKESLPYSQLKEYIKKKFNNEIKKFYFDQENKKEVEGSLSYRLAQTPYSTTKKPIHSFIQLFFAGKIFNPFLIEKPASEFEDKLLSEYNISGSSEEFFDKVDFSPLDSGSPIAKFNLVKKTLTINSVHPFIANNMNSFRNTLPMESMAMTEVLTEAHLYELGIDEYLINKIMRKRDNILRQLALSDRAGIPAVAQLLKDSISNPTGLEDAVYRAFLALGFEASKIGGKGTPDGKADAILGYENNKSLNYSITYEVKSTTKNRIAAETAKLSAVNRHKNDYSSTYAVEIAIGFEGEDDSESAISKEARQQKVTLIRVVDLVKLLFLAPPKQIGLRELRNLFEVYAPLDVTKWINEIEERKTLNGPFYEIVEIVYDLQKNDSESPTLSVVRMKYNENKESNKKLSIPDVKKLFDSLCTIVPGFVHIEGDLVSVEATPGTINSAIYKSIDSDVPIDLQKIYIDAFKS
jgi:hypothetical protein